MAFLVKVLYVSSVTIHIQQGKGSFILNLVVLMLTEFETYSPFPAAAVIINLLTIENM